MSRPTRDQPLASALMKELLAKQPMDKDARIAELERICGDMLNDYINFDDGHLTEVIFEEATKILRKATKAIY